MESAHLGGVHLFELERYSALAFSIPMKGDQISATVGDAIDLSLPQNNGASVGSGADGTHQLARA